MKTIYLVSCVSKKQIKPSRAKELYISDLFTKARSYVEATGAYWYILSAEHGLLSPEDMVEPYNKTLNTMPIDERRCWGEQVCADLHRILIRGDAVVLIAGAKYREFLIPFLIDAGITVEVPLKGKRIGEQLSWFKGQTHE